MPELYFKGKEFVHNHHLSVPYRPLIVDRDKSLGDGGLDDNLIIHGDNLHALKALLPRYAGKVDCVFIDPPYNTGNENWCYNDNVNNPVMKEWLSSNPVNKEDMLRHDKWCAMMWPRLVLLKELLKEAGSIWITLDDNEAHRMRSMCDEIFGEDSHEATIAWQKKTSRSNNAKRFSSTKDTVIVYRKSLDFTPGKERREDVEGSGYSNPDNDPRGPWTSVLYVNPATKEERKNLVYKIKNPHTGELIEHETNAWKFQPSTHKQHVEENRLWWGVNNDYKYPRLKVFFSDGIVPIDFWTSRFAGSTDMGTIELERIMSKGVFDNPKPRKLIEKILDLATSSDSIVLDSFAGSGTTAHAVLAANQKDGGNRKFILVECENYADDLTAERVRRVIDGYDFQGTETEELHQQKITFTSLKKAPEILENIQAITNIYGDKYDSIKARIKDDHLIVTGETKIKDRASGLGGSFTFCSLGDPIDMDDILTGKKLPDYQNLGAWLFHTATGEPLDGSSIDESKWHLGESSQFHVWLVYRPDLGFLKSREAALTLDLAETISATGKDKKHLVFAPARFVPNKTLLPMGVEHLPLPYALYRVNNA